MPIQLTSIKTLNRTKFENWATLLKLHLAITNLNLALHEDEPIVMPIQLLCKDLNMRN